MSISNEDARRLVEQGVAALQKGQPQAARQFFETITRTGRANAQIWLLLATACRAAEEAVAEEMALDQLLGIESRTVRGHIMKADCRARAGDERAALAFYESALLHAESQQLPPDLAAEVRRATSIIAETQARVARQRDDTLTAKGFPAEKRSPRFQQSLDILAGHKKIFVQEPSGYYLPGLPPIQYFDTADFDWVPALEAQTDAIRAELVDLLAAGTGDFRPYLQGDANKPRMDQNQLLDSPDWSALFLCENGQVNAAAIARCPKTWAALRGVPLLNMFNAPTVMFSLLRPGARIIPHTGMFNTRLICHLPLVVPSDCRFRVGNEEREWQVGKLIIFDDSIEHEAWNDSRENRVVLIFDVWRPELTPQERLQVSALMAGPAL